MPRRFKFWAFVDKIMNELNSVRTSDFSIQKYLPALKPEFVRTYLIRSY
jgi:hypothetical protein